MPYKALYNGETKPPQSVPENTTVECAECGDPMHIVKSHTRTSGSFVSRHFQHNPDHNTGGGGGGSSCGESDEHIKLKSIAASKLEHIFEESLWKCELEYRLENTATDAEHRDADALVLFDDFDEQLGQGVAVEVQYKNDDKDKSAVERDYQNNNISTVWVAPDDFGDHDMRLNETDIRHRAEMVGKKHISDVVFQSLGSDSPPESHADHLLFELRNNLEERERRVPVTLPEPVLERIDFRATEWSEFFETYPTDRFRLQASIPYADSTRMTSVTFAEWWFDTRRYNTAEWPQLFDEEIEPNDPPPNLTFAAELPARILVKSMHEHDFKRRFHCECRGCGKQIGPFTSSMTFAFHHCSCGVTTHVDTDLGLVERHVVRDNG